VKACRPYLGTYVEIRLGEGASDVALSAAFAHIERVRRCMSVFDADSDVSRINRLHPGETIEVDPWTHEVLSLACEVHRASGGLFDCGVAPHLARWGMLPSAVAAVSASSIASLELLAGHRVRTRAPLCIDLGGIAKGYAVDQAVTALQTAGVKGGVVNAGGDLRVFGEAEEDIWLRDPAEPEQLRHAGTLRDGACATSATYYSRCSVDGDEVSALVDPRTGAAVRTRQSYTVVAPRCAVADALTKVLAVAGEAGHPCLAAYGAQWVVLSPVPCLT
jgi:thiamine biosynthesis lipoprotein